MDDFVNAKAKAESEENFFDLFLIAKQLKEEKISQNE